MLQVTGPFYILLENVAEFGNWASPSPLTVFLPKIEARNHHNNEEAGAATS